LLKSPVDVIETEYGVLLYKKKPPKSSRTNIKLGADDPYVRAVRRG